MTRLLMVAALLLLVGCHMTEPGWHPCKRLMADTLESAGEPEEVNTYQSANYVSVSWWYWSRGWSIRFTWGQHVTGCQWSTYTFTPIGTHDVFDLRRSPAG